MDPELPGDLLQDLPNVISSSSILLDDVAAHTARIRSNARLAVMQFNDNLATRPGSGSASETFQGVFCW